MESTLYGDALAVWMGSRDLRKTIVQAEQLPRKIWRESAQKLSGRSLVETMRRSKRSLLIFSAIWITDLTKCW
jgi:hypothetical protein